MKHRVVFAVVMGAITSCIISFTLVSINLGYTSLFLFIWLRSWAIACFIATFSIMFIGPQVKKLVDRILK